MKALTRDTRPFVAAPDHAVKLAKLEQLTDRVWSAEVDGYRTIVIRGDSGVIAVNSFGTPSAATAFMKLIEDQFGSNAITATIQTIDHLDHAGQTGLIAGGGEVIAHELTAAVAYRRGAPGQAVATRVVTGERNDIEVDGVRIVLHYPGPTVGTGNLAIDLPDDDVVFLVGPLDSARYGMFPDFHFHHYVRAVTTIADLGRSIVVPGRGGVMTADGFRRSIEYVQDFQVACQRILADGTVIFWLLDPVADFMWDALSAKWGDLDGFEKPMLGLGAIRCVHHYIMGGWGIEDSDQPELMYEYGAVREFRELAASRGR